MSNKVNVEIRGQDKTAGAFKSVNDRLSGISKSVSSLNFMAMGEKAVQALKALGEASGYASAEAGKNFKSITDTMGGFTAEVGASIFKNKDFTTAINGVVASLAPLVTTLISAIMPAITAFVQNIVRVYEAWKPAIAYILSYVLPVFDKLAQYMKLLGNSWEIMTAYLTGNKDKLKELRTEQAGILKDLTTFARAKVDLTSSPSKLQAIGAKMSAKDGGTKTQKVEDPKKAIDQQYDALITLAQAGKLSALEVNKLASEYERYRLIVEKGTGSLDERTQALANVANFEKLVTEGTERETKALEDRNKVIADSLKLQGDQLEARIKLVAAGRGTNIDKSALKGELSILNAILPDTTDVLKREGISSQIDAITDALYPEVKKGAEKTEEMFSDAFGSAIQNGLSGAFSGEGLSGLFGGFFGSLKDSIASGIAGMAATWVKGMAKMAFTQAKITAAYGKILSALKYLFSNPVTAGAALVATGVALYAFSRSFGGGSSGGSYSGGSTLGSSKLTNTQRLQQLSGAQGGITTIKFEGSKMFDANDPNKVREFNEFLKTAHKNGQLVRVG